MISTVQRMTPAILTSKPIEFPKNTQIRSHFEDSNIPFCKENFSKSATKVLNAFYRSPLSSPEMITVRNLKGESVNWNSLPYGEQQEILTHHHRGGMLALSLSYEGAAYVEKHVPRWSHGLMHVTRVALLVRMAAHMYNQYGGFQISEKQIMLAQYLAVFHDSARQAEGVDVWDDESAENAYPFLIEEGFTHEVALECVQMLKEKDSSSPDKNILTKLIQCGDCIDIMRIYGFGGFRNECLDIYNDLSGSPGFNEELVAFRKEYHSFIQKTDETLLRVYLERKSENYFQETLSLMLMKEYGVSAFPLLSKWYEQATEAPKELTKLIFKEPSLQKWGDYIKLKDICEGTHASYLLVDKEGDLFFFKEQSLNDSRIEALASTFSSEIAGGLVPKAKRIEINSKRGIIEPYIELDKSLFKGYLDFRAERLTPKQKEQLLVHMIADYAIRNYDAHTGQFGQDKEGNIIAFDKGEAFKVLRDDSDFTYFYKNEPSKFDPNFYIPPLGDDRPTYAAFSQYLKNNPKQTQALLEKSSVKRAFSESTHLLKDRRFIQMLQSLSTKESTLKAAALRVQNVENDIRSYFE